MNDVGGVQVLEGAQNLIDEKLDVVNLETLLGPDHAAQISFHNVANQVNLTDHAALPWHVHHVMQAEDVLVDTVLHNHDFSQHSLCVNDVLNVSQAFDGALLVGLHIGGRNN